MTYDNIESIYQLVSDDAQVTLDEFVALIPMALDKAKITYDDLYAACLSNIVSDQNIYIALDMLMIEPCKWYKHVARLQKTALTNEFLKKLKRSTCAFDAIYQCRCVYHNTSIVEIVARSAILGRLGCLQDCYQRGIKATDVAVLGAAAFGKTDCVRFMHERGVALSNTNIGCTGFSESLRRLCFSQYPFSIGTYEYAAEDAEIDAISYLPSCKDEWDETDVIAATRAGRLSALEYLINNDCPLPTTIEYLLPRRADVYWDNAIVNMVWCYSCLKANGVIVQRD